MSLIKQLTEVRTYSFDFYANLALGETLATAVSVTAERTDGVTSDLSLGSPALGSSGIELLVAISGGTDGKTYRLYGTVTTTAGQTLVGYGELLVLKILPPC